MYKIFREGEERGKYVSVVGYDARTLLNEVNGMKVWRVELTDSPPGADAPAMVTSEQRGPNPAPVDESSGRGASPAPATTAGARTSTVSSPLTRRSMGPAAYRNAPI
ncbi:MAG: hypothetical protein ACXWZ2_16935 [Mycobacterium sp.]